MKAYTTDRLNENINAAIENDYDSVKLSLDFFKQWMIDNGHREEDKPLNRWYKHISGAIAFRLKEEQGFGVNYEGSWRGSEAYWFTNMNCWQLCPESEWQEMLINEAKKKGYKNGNYKCLRQPDNTFEDRAEIYWGEHESELIHKGANNDSYNVLFSLKTGEWASIIPSVPEYTMTEAIEKMGHKFKIIDRSKS